MSLLSTYLMMLFDPRKAFDTALSKKVWTLIAALFFAILCTGLLNAFYFTHVDFPWLVDQTTTTLSADQREAITPYLTPGRMLGGSLVGVVFLALVVNLIRAFIFWVILKVRGGESQRFVRLFAVVMWSTAPLAIILIAGILNISLAPEGRISGNDVNPVSLNQLIFHLPPTSSWGQMLSTFSLVNIWEMVLIGIGLQALTGMKLSKTMLIAITPDIIAYGIWSAALLAGGAA